MFLAYDTRVQNTGCGLQRINCRINSQLYDGTGKYSRSIQMCECRSRCRVCQVIRRHINGLYGCDGTALCGSDTLLKSTHLGLQCRLVSYCGRHTSKQGGNLGTCLRKTENIVDEQQDIFSCLVTEIFCHRKSGKTDTHTCSRRLVHLTEHHGGLIDNSGFLHLVIEVISFSCTLTNSGKYGISTVLGCDIVDQLLNQNGLSYTCSSEQTGLTAFLIRAKQIDYLDTGLQDLGRCGLFFKRRCFSVDR